MPIDPYTPCPGGTGKKIKFCCPDLVGELDKVQRMLEGDQRAATLEHIEQIEAKYPDRACLMSIKAMLQAQLGDPSKAEATLASFGEKYPDNPVALAEKAVLAANKHDAPQAVNLLQDALERSGEQMSPQVFDAIGLVADALVASNQLLAARAHLVLQLGIGGTQEQRPLQLLVRLNSSPAVPLLLKQDFPLLPAPDDALWKNSFNAAMEPAFRGAWRKSADELTALATKVGEWPAIAHNLGVLRAWLGDAPAAIEAWHKYAAANIPQDDAVEAEALAQLLDPESADLVEVMGLTYDIRDIERLQALLGANRQTISIPTELMRPPGEDEPPPRASFWLLDRAVPESGKDLSPDGIPRIVGQVFVFGKQTDREARLELAAYQSELADAKRVLSEIAGESLGSLTKEEAATAIPAVQHMLSMNWRLPEDTPPEQRFELMRRERERLLLEKWPAMPQNSLGGKSANEAAGDPALRVKLLASILRLEFAVEGVTEFDFNRLREKLGLPALEKIDPRTVRLAELPLVRLGRVDVKHLRNEELVDLYRRADHYHHIAATRMFAHEIVSRPDIEGVDKAEVYGVLAQTEPDAQKAFDYLDQARKAAEAAKTSTAPWDLAELSLRISRGDIAEADRLLAHLRDEHLREPGVGQALFQILYEAGIVGPDGRPTSAAAAAAARETPGIVVPGGAAPEGGKIWTPGSDQPAGGKKSGLWTPD